MTKAQAMLSVHPFYDAHRAAMEASMRQRLDLVFAARHGDADILQHICGLDFAAYDLRGIRLERTQTLAGGAAYCNFRFSSKPGPERKSRAQVQNEQLTRCSELRHTAFNPRRPPGADVPFQARK